MNKFDRRFWMNILNIVLYIAFGTLLGVLWTLYGLGYKIIHF